MLAAVLTVEVCKSNGINRYDVYYKKNRCCDNRSDRFCRVEFAQLVPALLTESAGSLFLWKWVARGRALWRVLLKAESGSLSFFFIVFTPTPYAATPLHLSCLFRAQSAVPALPAKSTSTCSFRPLATLSDTPGSIFCSYYKHYVSFVTTLVLCAVRKTSCIYYRCNIIARVM